MYTIKSKSIEKRSTMRTFFNRLILWRTRQIATSLCCYFNWKVYTSFGRSFELFTCEHVHMDVSEWHIQEERFLYQRLMLPDKCFGVFDKISREILVSDRLLNYCVIAIQIAAVWIGLIDMDLWEKSKDEHCVYQNQFRVLFQRLYWLLARPIITNWIFVYFIGTRGKC